MIIQSSKSYMFFLSLLILLELLMTPKTSKINSDLDMSLPQGKFTTNVYDKTSFLGGNIPSAPS